MQPLNPMEAMTGPKFARFYKDLKIDTKNGRVRSMKNKKFWMESITINSVSFIIRKKRTASVLIAFAASSTRS